MGVQDGVSRLPISPTFNKVNYEINANDDALEEIRLSEGDEDENGEETRKARIPRDPKKPSKEEIEEHNATHVPFRDWCPHCVLGSAPNRPHQKLNTDKYTIPHLVCDYCFLGDKEEGRAAGGPGHEGR